MKRKASLTGPLSEPDYAILITERDGVYELRIEELLIIVRSRELRDAYRLLLERKEKVIDMAREAGLFDRLPPVEAPVLVAGGRIVPQVMPIQAVLHAGDRRLGPKPID
jgi:hypothetical protein